MKQVFKLIVVALPENHFLNKHDEYIMENLERMGGGFVVVSLLDLADENIQIISDAPEWSPHKQDNANQEAQRMVRDSLGTLVGEDIHNYVNKKEGWAEEEEL